MTQMLTQFATAQPVLFTIIILVAVIGVLETFRLLFKLANRWIRHRNIVAAGWPPPHLDADGDPRPEPEREADDDLWRQTVTSVTGTPVPKS